MRRVKTNFVNYFVIYYSKSSPTAFISHCQAAFVHRGSAQFIVSPVPSPQQYLFFGLPLVTSAQSGQFLQFSPSSGWQIPSQLQVEVGGASVAEVACDIVVVVATAEVTGGTVVTGSSVMARQLVASWRAER